MSEAKGSEALQAALQTELDGMEFYRQAAKKCSDPLGKRMFESLVRDERNHIAWLHDIAKNIPPKDDCAPGQVFKKEIETVFKEAAQDIDSRVQPDTDDLQAIQIAKEMEEKAYRFYVDAERKAENEEERKLFARLAVEENTHWLTLEDAHLFLTAPAIWDLKNNPPLLD